MPVADLIESERPRKRSDSIPIITGVTIENSRDTDKKRGREELKDGENKTKEAMKEKPQEVPDSSKPKLNEEINSPEAKKLENGRGDENIDSGDDNNDELMQTIDIIDHDLHVVYVTKEISILELKTKDKMIRKLIDCYSPVLYGDFDLMRKHMLDLSEMWTEKENIFKNAIRYVLNNDENINETNIGELAEILLQAIENRMPKQCNDCEKWYVARRNTKPKVLCTWCKVSMHDCKEVNGIEDISGLRWFCKECNELFNNQFQPKMRNFKNIHFKGFNECNPLKQQIPPTKDQDTNEKEVINLDEEITEIGRVDNKDENKKCENENKKDENDEIKAYENKPDSKDIVTKSTCWHWVNRKCKFGNNCKNEHPVQCKTMMETGKCPDNRCKLIHPKICRGVYFEGYCSRRNCWYVHPTNIVNKYVFRDNYSTYNNNNNNNNNLQYHTPSNHVNNTQKGWTQNNQWNQSSTRDSPTFLDQWPTPWETCRSARMLVGKILEEVTSKIMNY